LERANCMNASCIIWCLFQQRSLILSPTIPFKNLSSLHSLCMKSSNLCMKFSIWITHFCPGEISEISFLRLWGLNRWNWLDQFRQFLLRTFRPVHFKHCLKSRHWLISSKNGELRCAECDMRGVPAGCGFSTRVNSCQIPSRQIYPFTFKITPLVKTY